MAAVAGATAVGVCLAVSSASAGTLSGSLYRDPNSAVVRWVAANPGDSRARHPRQDREPVAGRAGSPTSTPHGAVRGLRRSWAPPTRPARYRSYRSTRSPTGTAAGPAPVGRPTSTSTRRGYRLRQGPGQPDGHRHPGNRRARPADLPERAESRPATRRSRPRSQTIKAATPTPRCTSTAATPPGTPPASRPTGCGRPASSTPTASSPTCRTSTPPPTRRTTAGRSSPPSTAGVSGKHQVIDTSRNGGAAGDWCADDNTDRRIGHYPTTEHRRREHRRLPVGQAAGRGRRLRLRGRFFQPDLAFSLATGAPNPPHHAARRPPRRRRPAATPPPTTPPTTPPTSPPAGGGGYASIAVNQWAGGFTASVTVTAGKSDINGWTVTVALPGGAGSPAPGAPRPAAPAEPWGSPT